MQLIVLASTSIYRKTLLERLQLPFITHSPNINETPLPNETPESLVRRLSYEKAQAVAVYHPEAVIIGSDQVAVLNGQIIGKPGSHKAAKDQLQRSSGKTISFLTGLTVFNSATASADTVVDAYEVTFRTLNNTEIESYLLKEKPYDCAGSFKSEGLGIALFEEMKGDDPTSLIGLPLISLTRLLKNVGISVLND